MFIMKNCSVSYSSSLMIYSCWLVLTSVHSCSNPCVTLAYIFNNIIQRHRREENLKAFILKIDVLIVCSYHVTYTFQSESTLYGCLNVKELLARNRREISQLSFLVFYWNGKIFQARYVPVLKKQVCLTKTYIHERFQRAPQILKKKLL